MFLFLIIASLNASEPFEVAHYQTIITETNAPFAPRDLTRAGDRVFFSADHAMHGREPWVSDGTAAGTGILADLEPGTGGSDPQGFHIIGSRLYVRTHIDGNYPWYVLDLETDTVQPLDGPGGTYEGRGALTAGSLFYWTRAGELVQVDGTSSHVRATLPAPLPTRFGDPVVMKDRVYVVTAQAGEGFTLWKESNGVFQVVSRFIEDKAVYSTHYYVSFGLHADADRLYAWATWARGPKPHAEIWTSDGTAEGTGKLWEVTTESYSDTPITDSAFVDDTLYFSLRDGAGYRLAAAKNGVFYWVPGSGFIGGKLGVSDNGLLFSMSRAPGTSTLHVLPDDNAQPVPLLNARDARHMKQKADGFTYGVATVSGVYAVFRTDGTPEGTEVLGEGFADDCTGVHGRYIAAMSGELGFLENGETTRVDMNGLPRTTAMDVYRGGVVQDRFYFLSDGKLWEGFPDNALPVAELDDDMITPWGVGQFGVAGDNDYYFLEGGRNIWMIRAGNATRLRLNENIAAVQADDKTTYLFTDSFFDKGLFTLDSETLYLRELDRLRVRGEAASVFYRDKLWFPKVVDDDFMLARTDGNTVETVVRLTDRVSDRTAQAGIRGYLEADGYLYIEALEPHRVEDRYALLRSVLFRTDGSNRNTIRLGYGAFPKALSHGVTAIHENRLHVVAGDDLQFLAELDANAVGWENSPVVDGQMVFAGENGLWITDGSPEGTAPWLQTPVLASPFFIGTLGSKLLVGTDAGDKPGLWAVDRHDRSLTSLGEFSSLRRAAEASLNHAGKFYFPAETDRGDELWVTDGTVVGTRLVEDLEPGPKSSYPTNPAAAGDTLWFRAFTGEDWSWFTLTEDTVVEPEPLKIRLTAPSLTVGSCPRTAWVSGDPEGAEIEWEITNGRIEGDPTAARIRFHPTGIEAMILKVTVTDGNRRGTAEQRIGVVQLPRDPCAQDAEGE
ncbi:MAG: hypothetical protein QNK37_05920 [Acidobacteriota bacterium]|nr:hypothetical protein [Acidobacteriota bacterium]